jgi:hypothetical protein
MSPSVDRSRARPIRRLALILLSFLAAAAAFTQAPGKRVALVIGNGAYTRIQSLKNPANDAADMAASLRRLGFSVLDRTDADRKTMRSLIDDFAIAIRGADIALFYYSGHGVQAEGENYLVPLNADVTIAADVPEECVPLSRVLARMVDSEAATSVVILDACRDNPFKAVTRGIERGLAVVGRKPAESIIVYATAENEKAEDGSGRNGVFTAALLANLERVEPLADLLLDVKAQVRDATADKQKPAVYENLTRKVYLSGSAASAAPLVPLSPPAAAPEAGTKPALTAAASKPSSPWTPRSVGLSVGLMGPVSHSNNVHYYYDFRIEGLLDYFPARSSWLGLRFASGFIQRSVELSPDYNRATSAGAYFVPLGLGPVAEFTPLFFLSLRASLLPTVLIRGKEQGIYTLHFQKAVFALQSSAGIGLNFTPSFGLSADAVYQYIPPEGITAAGISSLSLRVLMTGHFIAPKDQ